MKEKNKKLSIAFYWHMHQPVYQLNPAGDYLMPWVRLHAVKDYLDMLLLMRDFPKLKLNFNLVPVLLDALIDYGEKGAHDIHSRLTITDIKDLTREDKEFILNNFFDANYQSMIVHHEGYNKLYQKRFVEEKSAIEDFSDQEFSDLMAWFNLAWFDPLYKDIYPQLSQWAAKNGEFSFEDRIAIIELQREIIRKIIPTYREYLENGRIEITTSPYYHPILPILLDIKSVENSIAINNDLPKDMALQNDAKLQTKLALDRIEELFGKRPRGVWPSEHCVDSNTLAMLKEQGVAWVISDEGILANSINFEFVRDFKGYLEDPYFLTKTYKYKTPSSEIDMVFRNSGLANLISFEYPYHNPKIAAGDFYERLKVLQDKLITSPDDSHLITIALDGENCWENYEQDGITFLKEVYHLICEDESLETVLLSDYIEDDKSKRSLKKIYGGSWINRDFQLWIGEPVKNIAWTYLKQVHDDFEKFKRENAESDKILLAQRELFIAEGSDWFWWYGEPNNSGQDHIFDYIFREHLKNVYRVIGVDVPKYLDAPLISVFTRPSRYPKTMITPTLDGTTVLDDEWLNAGCINMPDGPVLQENKLFDKICYGYDEQNLYLRFYLNQYVLDKSIEVAEIYQMYVYLRNPAKRQSLSSLRLINKTEGTFPILREKFHNEIQLSFAAKVMFPIRIAKAMPGGVWALENPKNVRFVSDKVADVSIPFELLDVASGETLEFFFLTASSEIKDSFIPQDNLLTIQRP